MLPIFQINETSAQRGKVTSYKSHSQRGQQVAKPGLRLGSGKLQSCSSLPPTELKTPFSSLCPLPSTNSEPQYMLVKQDRLATGLRPGA